MKTKIKTKTKTKILLSCLPTLLLVLVRCQDVDEASRPGSPEPGPTSDGAVESKTDGTRVEAGPSTAPDSGPAPGSDAATPPPADTGTSPAPDTGTTALDAKPNPAPDAAPPLPVLPAPLPITHGKKDPADLLDHSPGWYLVKGSSPSAWFKTASEPATVRELRFGDVNGDGRADVLKLGKGRVWTSLSLPKHRFSTWIDAAAGPADVADLAVGDLDGDGRTDLLRRDTVDLEAAAAKGDGTFQAWKVLGPEAASCDRLLLADLDGANGADLICAGNGQLFVAPIAANKPLAWSKVGAWQWSADHLAVGDFNGDTRADLFRWTQSGGWHVADGVGNGSFKPWRVVMSSNYARPAHTMERLSFLDWNGDGRTDVVRDEQEEDRWQLAAATPSGTLGYWSTVKTLKPMTFAVADTTLADFDGDKIPDIFRATPAEFRHRTRFFISPKLLGAMSKSQLAARLSQYIADINLIYKSSRHRFDFSPADITVTTSAPYDGMVNYRPVYEYEAWIDLIHTSEATSIPGAVGDQSGAIAAARVAVESVLDSKTLVDGSTALKQYWTAVTVMSHELGHMLGLAIGEYYTHTKLKDLTGVAPILDASISAPGDPYWSQRKDMFGDVMTGYAWMNPNLGTPTALADLRAKTKFSALSLAVLDHPRRWAASRWQFDTHPDLSQCKVRVIDAATQQPIPGATVKVWRVVVSYPHTVKSAAIDLTGKTDAAGVLPFSWDYVGTNATVPYPTVLVFNNAGNTRLIKAYAAGYKPAAAWATTFDAQRAKMVDGKSSFVVTVALEP